MKVEEILADKLKLHGMTTKKLVRTNNFLCQLDLNEMCTVLNFLLKIFTYTEISNNTKLLKYTVPVLEQRISKLKSLGIKNVDPKCLAKPEKDFEKYLKMLKNENKNK